MERLTKKLPSNHYYPTHVKDQYNIWIDELLSKLGQLEDIEDVIGMSLIDYFKGISFDIEKNNQYLKLEEELGIDLITLFKALKQETLFIKTELGIKETIKHGEGWALKHFSFENGEPFIFTDIFYPNEICKQERLTPLWLKPRDYGKAWALTKEELE